MGIPLPALCKEPGWLQPFSLCFNQRYRMSAVHPHRGAKIMPPCSIRFSASLIVPLGCRDRPYFWFAVLAMLGCLLSPAAVLAQNRAITLRGDGGDAWTFEKNLEGELPDGECDEVLLASSRATVEAWQADGRFGAVVPLLEGDNEVRAICRLGGADRSVSEPQHWRVRLRDSPKAWIRIVPAEDGIELDAGASEPAPGRSAPIVLHQWQSVPEKPGPLTTADGLTLGSTPIASDELLLRMPGIEGEYQVTLRVTDALGRTDESTAAFVVENGQARAAELAEERPAWLDSAVVYGVVPFFFGPRGFDDVTARLDAIRELGATVLWLSPITGTEEGDFGYAVTDHFGLRDAFGTEQDLRELMTAADVRGLRVMMDFVPNHTSEQHPYYRSAEQRGPASPYYDFYDRNAAGEVTTYFDWENLKNLNYDNPEVQNYMIEAFAYWVREFGIDGFRADAVWGVRERAPEFWPRLRDELKRIDPDLLLLAEASARDPYYDIVGFDAAYDWTNRLGEWAWRDAFEAGARTATRLRAALIDSRMVEAEAPMPRSGALVFRFLNNNDTGERFVTRYGVARTRLAATMLLTLPGLPLLYTGDQVGAEFEPYDEGPVLSWTDLHGLREHYGRLVALRRDQSVLRSERLEILETSHPESVLAYVRPGDQREDDIIVLLNYDPKPVRAALPATAFIGTRSLLDLISGAAIPSASEVSAIDLPGWGARVLRRGTADVAR
jgi:cyclomaltodextrinase / maltogenic alpha-amylase / neopullulanase